MLNNLYKDQSHTIHWLDVRYLFVTFKYLIKKCNIYIFRIIYLIKPCIIRSVFVCIKDVFPITIIDT